MKVLLVVMLLIVCVPDVATVPLQSPEPVHEVASVDTQESCVLPPIATEVGFALRDSVGTGTVVPSLSSELDPKQPASRSAQVAMLTAPALRNMANRGTEKTADSNPRARVSTRARNARLSQPIEPPPELSSPLPPPPPPGATVTVTLSLAEPPAPVQLIE